MFDKLKPFFRTPDFAVLFLSFCLICCGLFSLTGSPEVSLAFTWAGMAWALAGYTGFFTAPQARPPTRAEINDELIKQVDAIAEEVNISSAVKALRKLENACRGQIEHNNAIGQPNASQVNSQTVVQALTLARGTINTLSILNRQNRVSAEIESSRALDIEFEALVAKLKNVQGAKD